MAAPTIGSLAVYDDTVQVPIDDMGDSPSVRVDYAIGDAEPASYSLRWREVGTLETVGELYTPSVPDGSTVWVRAVGTNAVGDEVSSFAPSESIVVEDVGPKLLSAGFAFDADLNVVITWETNDVAYGVRILWEITAQGYDPGDLSTYEDLDAADEVYTLPDTMVPGEMITIRIEAWETWDDVYYVVGGTKGDTLQGVLYRNTELVDRFAAKLHASEHAEGAADELDLETCFLVSPDSTRWKLTVTNSGDLVAEEIV